jgi:hypothetical protein
LNPNHSDHLLNKYQSYSSDFESLRLNLKPYLLGFWSQNHSNSSGIYMRDDHCDWGSSGMNEFTNEYNSN